MTRLSPPHGDSLAIRGAGHWPTADRAGAPHVVPVCYAIDGDTLYITIDEKPKQSGGPLKRLRNIAENPAVAVVVDRYDEAWARPGWVMVLGRAEILAAGAGDAATQALLTAGDPHY